MTKKQKHVPLRMCCICRKRAPKVALKRFTQAEGSFLSDLDGTAPGRGVYICTEERCRTAFSRRTEKRKERAVNE